MHTATETLHFGQPLAQATGALILLHGRGSSAADIAGLTTALDAGQFAGLAPAADGGTWYPQRFFVPLPHNEPWLSSALKTVDDVAREVIATGIPAERIGLIGFSQGACLALEHTARAGRRYGFTAALSGALIGPLATPRPPRDLAGTPILLGCAEADAHIPLEFVEHSATTLEAMNARVTKPIYRGAAHTVFPQELAWINQRLATLGRRADL
jgi:phospholipase/carboxylesterase